MIVAIGIRQRFIVGVVRELVLRPVGIGDRDRASLAVVDGLRGGKTPIRVRPSSGFIVLETGGFVTR